MAQPDYARLASELRSNLPGERTVTDPFRTVAWSADASFYQLRPQIVVTVESEDDVHVVLAGCRHHGAPVTFRAAGTSLSGQAVTDSVLVRLGDGWRAMSVLEDGRRIRLGAGVIGGHANGALRPYGRKLGPDPASINACMIGGIVANNASGMCCGTEQNSYQTVEEMRLILADGTLVDTGDADSVDRFRASHGALLDALAGLRAEVLESPVLADRIRRKFAIKNTTGYSLNAFIDFEDPLDILQHLVIGSEGTLAFISDVTYRTVVDPAFKAAALAFFETPRAAADAVTALVDSPAAAIELIDRAGLRTAHGQPNLPDFVEGLGAEATALLIEVQAESADLLTERVAQTEETLNSCTPLHPVLFSVDPAQCAAYWSLRKGLFPSVGAERPIGTAVIIEDVAFPIEHLGAAVTDLQTLFARHGYRDAVLFGHARDGNLHVVFSQDFSQASEVDRYARFMDELCSLVAHRYDGSLKAEHGTGRNVAPYVELEWGRDAIGLMRRIKKLFDPDGILNPGVVLNDDPKVHLKNLKALPAADPTIDKCTECGFCESHCPSHLLTTSPRQRTVAWRFTQSPSNEEADIKAVDARFKYLALDTCAACGLCQTVCPVQIDTGAFVKGRRAHHVTRSNDAWATWVADHFGTVTDATGLGLRAGVLSQSLFGSTVTQAMSGAATTLTAGNLPRWIAPMPDGYRFEPSEETALSEAAETIVYLPSCVSRTMRPAAKDDHHDPLPVVVTRLAARAGVRLVYPNGIKELCCGQPFESKGMAEQAEAKAAELFKAVKGDCSSVRVLSDTSPCSYRLKQLSAAGVEIIDIVEFLHDLILPRLPLSPVRRKLAVHATCSIRKLGLTEKLQRVAEACAPEVVTPADVECCGFAGDRGFTTPELNAHALRHLKGAVNGADAGTSTSVTCEIGLARHSGLPYRSIAYYVDEATTIRETPETT